MWLSQEGPRAKKHRGPGHPLAVFFLHYLVVAISTVVLHDAAVRPRTANEAAAATAEPPESCPTLPHVAGRQRAVSSFLAAYIVLYLALRLALALRAAPSRLYCEFYRQTFLCSGTIANAALAFASGRTAIAQAFCLAVGIDQLLW